MLIGMTGRAGSGKNTVASMLRDATQDRFKEIAFAEPLKEFCKVVFDWTDSHVYGHLKDTQDFRYYRPHAELRWYEYPWDFVRFLFGKKPWEPRGPVYLTPRYAMQRLGTEWGRDCFPEIWVVLCQRRWRDLAAQGTSIIVTDVRFPNEAKAIQREGRVWRVERPDDAATPANHASETMMDKIKSDRIIWNGRSLDVLRAMVLDAIREEDGRDAHEQ